MTTTRSTSNEPIVKRGDARAELREEKSAERAQSGVARDLPNEANVNLKRMRGAKAARRNSPNEANVKREGLRGANFARRDLPNQANVQWEGLREAKAALRNLPNEPNAVEVNRKSGVPGRSSDANGFRSPEGADTDLSETKPFAHQTTDCLFTYNAISSRFAARRQETAS